ILLLFIISLNINTFAFEYNNNIIKIKTIFIPFSVILNISKNIILIMDIFENNHIITVKRYFIENIYT
ncbi:MAG TPA: hypothetical protein VGC75_00890, partial [Candidatus Nitrosocosmicus sp.]